MNLASIIDPHPDGAPALISGGETATYGSLRRQVAAVRGGLTGLGLEPGDRAAIISASNWYFVVAYLAVLGAGGVAVPLNPQSPALELAAELQAVRPRIVFVGPTAQAAFAEVDRQAAAIDVVLVPEGVSLPDTVPFEDLLVADPVPIAERGPHDLAACLFTSGTAGAPKAAMLSHGNLLANIRQAQAAPDGAVLPTDVTLCALPLFHIYGLNGLLGIALYAGACVVLVQRFDPASALETIVDRKVTLVAGVPPMFEAWNSLPPGEGEGAMAGVRRAASGASRLEPETAAAFEARYGVRIGEGYGLTEASPIVTSADPSSPRTGTIGLPLPGVEVRLVDENGEDALVGDPGEIWVRGPNVFLGYLDDAAATARALTPDGWLRTGDIAVADDDGFLSIVDRAKDLIIVSGFNVYPAEVEGVLRLHPGVAEAAVVGVPHPHTGEAVKAFVVAKSHLALEEDEVITFCAKHVARYKCPSKVRFVAALPHGLGGKIIRRALPLET